MMSLCQKNCFCTLIRLYDLRLYSSNLKNIQKLFKNTNFSTCSDLHIDPDNIPWVDINSSLDLDIIQCQFEIAIRFLAVISNSSSCKTRSRSFSSKLFWKKRILIQAWRIVLEVVLWFCLRTPHFWRWDWIVLSWTSRLYVSWRILTIEATELSFWKREIISVLYDFKSILGRGIISSYTSTKLSKDKSYCIDKKIILSLATLCVRLYLQAA